MTLHPGSAAGSRRAGVREREDQVITRLQALAPQLDGEPDARFRAETRARLVAMAAVRSPAPEPVSPLKRALRAGSTAVTSVDTAPPRWRARLTAGLAGAAVAVTGLAALVAVSTGAQPGDALYGLKRGTEQTQLALAGDATRGQTLLDFASTRLAELRLLVDGDAAALPVAGAADSTVGAVLAAGADTRLVRDTLATMDAQTAEGAAWQATRALTTRDTGVLQALNAWGAGQFAGLAELQPAIPAEAQEEFAAALELLTQVDARTDALALALTCPSGPAVNGSDGLGPLPVTCADDAVPPSAPGEVPGGTPAVPTTVPEPPQPSPLPPGSSGEPSLPTVPGAPTVPGLPRVPGIPGATEPTGGLLPTLPLPTLPNPFDLPPPSPTLPGVTLGVPGTDAEVGLGGEDVLRACVPPLIVVNCE